MSFSTLTKTTLIGLSLMSGVALAADHRVAMLNQGADGTMVFEPGYLAVAPGDTVTFVPTDSGHNTVSVLSPDQGTTWRGDFGEAVTVTLNQEGVYLYQCDPHLPLGMVGVIQVGKGTNLEDARAQAAKLEEGMAMNQGRLEHYLDQVH